MSQTMIQVQGLGKRYRIGVPEKYKTLRDSLAAMLSAPIRRLRSAGHVNGDAESTIWALKDISFEVGQGEVVGIVGRNGAGKSTLLKVLSRITEPTEGSADMAGRVGSLLEVGTGFHPELTGRENLFLNGAILGMSRVEVASKFDEIVEFADIAKFLDTPVKRYSSGMYMRLAFAIAAHLEPEILIVDEVLAVGDAVFQKKCLGKMDSVAKAGRTILFVSHNLQALRGLCTRGLFMSEGRLVMDGPIDDVLNRYNSTSREASRLDNLNVKDRRNRTSGQILFTSIEARDRAGEKRWDFRPGEAMSIRCAFRCVEPVRNIGFYMAIKSGVTGDAVTSFKQVIQSEPVAPGTTGTIVVDVPELILRPGDYSLYICIGDTTFGKYYDVVDENVSLPWLVVSTDDHDPHLHGGYFTMRSTVTAT